ncbi:MAG TPA: formate dehydrogenase, partial [Halomonas sp.]|nr:formate dehydrogenase [Halomonas sp.]
MRLTRKTNTPATTGLGISRRQFLKRTGVATGGVAAAGFMGAPMMQRTEAADKTPVLDSPVETKRTICSHCSVGCGVYAEVQEGIWTKQEPAFDHPINRGAHCAKGASLRQHGHSTRRLKYPMKLVAGEWQRLSWDDAVNEIGDKLLELRDAHGPDSVYWLG